MSEDKWWELTHLRKRSSLHMKGTNDFKGKEWDPMDKDTEQKSVREQIRREEERSTMNNYWERNELPKPGKDQIDD